MKKMLLLAALLLGAGCASEEGAPLKHMGDRKEFEMLKRDVPELKARVAELEHETAKLKSDVARHERDAMAYADRTKADRLVEAEFIEMNLAREVERKFLKNYPALPTWSDEMKVAIAEGRVTVGMTIAQVCNSWGQPSDLKNTTTEKGKYLTATFVGKKYWTISPPAGKWVIVMELRPTGDDKKDFFVTSITSEKE